MLNVQGLDVAILPWVSSSKYLPFDNEEAKLGSRGSCNRF